MLKDCNTIFFMRWLLTFSLFCSLTLGFAQKKPISKEDSLQQISKKINGYLLRAKIVNGDTIPFFNLREVIVWAEYVFTNDEEKKAYKKLLRDVKRVYPQAIIIAATVRNMQNETEGMSKHQRKKYLQQQEDTLRNQFEKAFKSNTVDQAEILNKLIDRETGQTAHQIIKDLRGGWSAMKWQTVSRIVGTNLKDEYHPDGEDKNIEKIVKQIEDGVVW